MGILGRKLRHPQAAAQISAQLCASVAGARDSIRKSWPWNRWAADKISRDVVSAFLRVRASVAAVATDEKRCNVNMLETLAKRPFCNAATAATVVLPHVCAGERARARVRAQLRVCELLRVAGVAALQFFNKQRYIKEIELQRFFGFATPATVLNRMLSALSDGLSPKANKISPEIQWVRGWR